MTRQPDHSHRQTKSPSAVNATESATVATTLATGPVPGLAVKCDVTVSALRSLTHLSSINDIRHADVTHASFSRAGEAARGGRFFSTFAGDASSSLMAGIDVLDFRARGGTAGCGSSER